MQHNHTNEERRQKFKHFKGKPCESIIGESPTYNATGAICQQSNLLDDNYFPVVYVKVNNTLKGISDLNQTFTCDLVVHLAWEIKEHGTADDRNKAHNHKKKVRMTRSAPDWTPILEFENLLSQEVSHESYSFYGDKERKNGVYTAKINWIIVVSEPLELQRFPFDRQILTLCVSSANCTLMQFSHMEHLLTGEIFYLLLCFVSHIHPFQDIINAPRTSFLRRCWPRPTCPSPGSTTPGSW
jgi:hypothetical protein